MYNQTTSATKKRSLGAIESSDVVESDESEKQSKDQRPEVPVQLVPDEDKSIADFVKRNATARPGRKNFLWKTLHPAILTTISSGDVDNDATLTLLGFLKRAKEQRLARVCRC
jgi:hypothetical protein